MIRATKNGHSKNFSRTVWNMMGASKNGWVPVSDSVAANIAKTAVKPDSGQEEKGVATNQVVNNLKEVKKEEGASVENRVFVDKAEADLAKNKIDFISVIKESGITKNAIKNYLDSIDKPYKTGDNVTELSISLYESLNGNIAELKSKFSI